jgi:hypothetical protein
VSESGRLSIDALTLSNTSWEMLRGIEEMQETITCLLKSCYFHTIRNSRVKLQTRLVKTKKEERKEERKKEKIERKKR